MRRQVIQIPRSFQTFGRWQREGEAGVRWLATLPDTIATLCERWNLVVDGEPRHGDNGVAVPVLPMRQDREPLVLKVSWPDHLVAEQALALRFWDGRGTVRLHDTAPEVGALLLERLDDRRTLLSLPVEQALPVIGTLLRRLAIPAPPDSTFRTTTGVAADLRDSLRGRWEAAGRPLPESTLDTAIAVAGELAQDAPSVMVDSDLHYEQVLSSEREPWLVIDPQVLVGDIEYQCGQLLWTRLDEMADSAGLRWSLDALTEAAQLDPARARAWALLRAVDYRLWGLAAGFTEDPVRCQRIVEALL